MTRFVVKLENKSALEWLAATASGVRASLKGAVTNATSALYQAVQERLSTDRRGSESFGNKIRLEVIDDGEHVTGRVFADTSAAYARLREYGGKIAMPEIAPVRAKALAFHYQGKLVFAKRVKAHEIDIDADPFLRPSLAEIAPLFQADLSDAIDGALG